MMNCRRVENLLSDHLDGVLPKHQASAITAHLSDCHACRRLRVDIMRVRADYRELADQLPLRASDLSQRAIETWVHRRTYSPARRSAHALRFAAAALVLLAALGLGRIWWGNDRSEEARIASIVHNPPLKRVSPLPGSSAVRRHDSDRPATQDGGPPPPPRGSRPAVEGPGGQIQGVRSTAQHRTVPQPPTGPGTQPSRAGAGPSNSPHSVPVADDLDHVNSAPATSAQQLAGLSRDESDQIEKRVRRVIRVRDDFVHVPFPRLVSTSNAQVAAAVESYKREAAIVDPRLSREVTLAAKATALSDLCDQIRTATGIRVEAGRSVADEKVSVFCEKMPLRDVMRRLARPFGYTWLRSTTNDQRPTTNASEPSVERRASSVEYRYELVQDLRSQLLEEELRNRDRNAALIALAQNIERCRPLMNLTPDEARARAKTASPAEKEILELGWGPLQMYFRLSPQELAALRAGQRLKFNQEPQEGELLLPADVARGVIERLPEERFLPRGDGFVRTTANDPNGVPLTALPDVRALVTLTLNQSELGRFTLSGSPGFSAPAAGTVHVYGDGIHGPANVVGQSPRVLQPGNRLANAALSRDPALQKIVTVKGQGARGKGQGSGTGATRTSTGPSSPDPRPSTLDPKLTTADVLEALHRASGMPIVADYYTRLYDPRDVTVQDRPLFEALNRLADTMRMRWTRDAGTREAGGWLQFRTTSYYDDRLKEVPNRLLARWAASRKERGYLSLEELIEVAQLTDAQLKAEDMAAGARELFGLEEWNFVRKSLPLAHLRYLAGFTPAQREAALSPVGLPFARMTLAQQQEFTAFVFVRYYYGPKPPPNVDLQDLAGALLRVAYTPPAGLEWRRPSRPGEELDTLFRVHGQTREAVLTAARQIDPQASPDQIVPAERSLAFAYIAGRREDGPRGLAIWATDGGDSIIRATDGGAVIGG